MFGILRYKDGRHILEPTGARNSRQGNLVRVACLSCRSKKLKCSGERPGCERCTSRQQECIYSVPPDPDSSASKRTREKSKTPDAPVNEPMVEDETGGGQMHTGYASPDKTMLQCMFDQDFDFDIPETGDIFTTTDIHAPEYFGSLWNNGSDQSHSSDPSAQLNFPTPQSLASLETRPPSGMQPGAGCSLPLPCTCFESALKTHETVEINLSWGISDVSGNVCNSSFEALQWLKTAIQRCDALLECVACCSRPEHITIVMSMCHKVLQAVRDLYHGTGGRKFGPCNSKENGASVSLARPNSSYGPTRNQEKLSESSLSTSASSISGYALQDQRRQSESSRESYAGSWELDDEDELQALRSILRLRMEKLSKLIEKLERVVSFNRWPAHTRVVQAIRDQFAATASQAK